MPREPAYAAERSPEGESEGGIRESGGHDARRERPATGHGQPLAPNDTALSPPAQPPRPDQPTMIAEPMKMKAPPTTTGHWIGCR